MSEYVSNFADMVEQQLSLNSYIILSLLSGVFLVFLATRKLDLVSLLVSLIVAGIIFLFLSEATGQNLKGSLPKATYPPPPHLGLGDVSLEKHMAF